MSRSDQYIGLTPRAKAWLFNWLTTGTKSYVYDIIEGAWTDEVASLSRYPLRDGREVEEFVQATVWSSGPMYFVGLRYVGCKEMLPDINWTDAEIDATV